MIRLILVAAFALFLLHAGAFASVIKVSDQEMAGRADLIVIGRVEKVWEKRELPSWVTDPSGWAEVTVEKVYTGPKLKTVTLRFFTGERTTGLTDLQAGQQRLFLLEQVRGGYTPIGAYQGIRPIQDAEHFIKLMQSFPMEVSFSKPPEPIYFGQSTTIQFKVTNRSKTPVKILGYPMLEGYHEVAEMERYGSFYKVVKSEEDDGKKRTLAPGESLTVKFKARGVKPKAWKNRMLAPVAVRIHVGIIPDGQSERIYAYSGWKATSVGYARRK